MEKLPDKGLEGILITNPENIFYLTGADNVEGSFFIHKEGSVMFTDFRYLNALQEIDPFFDIIQCQRHIEDMAGWLIKNRFKEIGFESAHFRFYPYERLKEASSGVNLIPCLDFVEKKRLIKDEDELVLIGKSAQILGKVMDKVPEMAGHTKQITERDIAIELEYIMKKEGAQRPAFDTIVASGRRSAFPHCVPGDHAINDENILLIDCGVVYKGYHTDMTRVMLLEGTLDRRIQEIYNIVREAQENALRSVTPGVLAKDVDAAARGVIEKAGFGDNFGHSTGHGVGLMVHEGPKINHNSEIVLEKGMVLTIEPGIYLQNEFGIRWEDTMLVTGNGYKTLTAINWNSLTPS
ncbi:aminopeptidase P family protein [bacterium]|nr:aminopeptidase P family protein [bacterium]